jgi:hypothetical protein
LVAAGIIDWWARNSSDQTTGAVASAELAVLCYSANWKQLISDSLHSLKGALDRGFTLGLNILKYTTTFSGFHISQILLINILDSQLTPG